MTRNDIRRLIRAHVTRQEGQIAAFTDSLYRLFDRALTKNLRELQSGSYSAIEAAAKISEIGKELEAAGFKDIAKTFLQQSYKAELEQVQRYMDLSGIRKGLDIRDIEAAKVLAELDFEKINTTLNRELGTIRGQVMRQVIMGETLDVDGLRKSLGDKTTSYIETEVRTGTMAFNRAVMVEKGKSSFGENPRFIYIGPDDAVTRPWCAAVLLDRDPPIYTKEEIEAMEPGPGGLDPLIYGGGYNCRHGWSPVSDEYSED